jgi:TonB family protein
MWKAKGAWPLMRNIHRFILTSLLFGQLMSYPPALSQTASPRLSALQEVSKPQGEDKKSEEKGEIDRMMDDLKSRNEPVLGVCEEGAKCEPLKVNGQIVREIVNGRIISKPQPAYPPVAKVARASGEVKVQVIVGKDGRVLAAKVLSGHPLLAAAALKAAREATFTPTLLDGKPVNVSGLLVYHFAL